MIDFVVIPPFLRITLQVAMATMHFHIAQTGLCFKNIVICLLGSQGTMWHPLEIILEVQGRLN